MTLTFPSLIFPLDIMLADNVQISDVQWEVVVHTIHALAFLSEQEWAVRVMNLQIMRLVL